MVAYQILFAPIGLLVLCYQLFDRKLLFHAPIGLKQMLATMMIDCVASAISKFAYFVNDDQRAAVAVGLGELVVAGDYGCDTPRG